MLLNPIPDQSLLQETTSTFLDELVPPAALRQLRDDPTGEPDGYWARGAELGWTSLLVSETDGGGAVGEHGLVDLTLIAYEFGRHAAPGPLVPTNIVASILSQRGGGAHSDAVATLVAGERDRRLVPRRTGAERSTRRLGTRRGPRHPHRGR